jgi:hypothetical protein
MPANPDHIRRDAEHAARSELNIFLQKFQRRMYEEAKAHIAEQISSGNGGVLDGTEIGRDSAIRAIGAYIEADGPREPVDSRALETAETSFS